MVGAREHYAVPRLFHKLGKLERFYTDAWFPRGVLGAHRLGRSFARLASRFHPELRSAPVRSFGLRMIPHETRFRLFGSKGYDANCRFWVEQGKLFGRLVCGDLARRTLDPSLHMYFGFTSTGLETYRWLRERGVQSVHDEVGAAGTYERLLKEEIVRFPGWEQNPPSTPDFFLERSREEWNSASAVLVNSEFSRRALIEQGAPADRMVVVPLAYQPSGEVPDRSDRTGPLRVLFLGRASLMKGIPDFLAAARLVSSRAQFRVVGPMHVAQSVRESAPSNVEWTGAVSRGETAEHYRWADVFVFPTICDGFGMTQIEAMAFGLPVISTTNCGDVVTDGVDGFRVPIRSPEAIADRLNTFADDRSLRVRMSEAAARRSTAFSLERYYECLLSELQRVGLARTHTAQTTSSRLQ
jgi:glycosyltransferase involved in cell wall biosynthesis